MGFFSRFSQAAIEEHFPETQVLSVDMNQASVEDSMPELNLQQVLTAHRNWKTRLQNVLEGTSNEHFDIEVVSQDCHCFLGRWIYSRGKKQFGHLPEYESVRAAHADFHAIAGQVLTEHMLGDVAKAHHTFKAKFRTASNRNQLELAKLFSSANVAGINRD